MNILVVCFHLVAILFRTLHIACISFSSDFTFKQTLHNTMMIIIFCMLLLLHNNPVVISRLNLKKKKKQVFHSTLTVSLLHQIGTRTAMLQLAQL